MSTLDTTVTPAKAGVSSGKALSCAALDPSFRWDDGLALRRRFRLKELKHLREAFFELMTRHNHIDHTVLMQILGTLEAFGYLFADCVLNNPLASKADERAGLSNMDITEHGVTRGDAAGCRLGEDDDVGKARRL